MGREESTSGWVNQIGSKLSLSLQYIGNQKEMIIMCITKQRRERERGWEGSVVCNQRWWETKSGKGGWEKTSYSCVSRSDFEKARISFNNKEVITDEPLCKFFVEPKASAWNKSLKWNTEESLVLCLDVIHIEDVTTTEMKEMERLDIGPNARVA